MPKGFKDAIEFWMLDHIGSKFEDRLDMAIQCGNSVGCSSVTSDRWIVQLATRNGPFRVVIDDDGDWVIKKRG